MRLSSLLSSGLVASLLAGCIGEPPPPTEEPPQYSELPARQTIVSGVVFDPEVFFFSLATFPQSGPPGPNTPPPPPPFLFSFVPYLHRAIPVGARVSVMEGATVADTSDRVSPSGYWQVTDVPHLADAPRYNLRAEPTAAGITIGAPQMYPSPPFMPVPQGKYFPTTSLNRLRTGNTNCMAQLSTIAGENGALNAVASMRGETVEQLLDPSRTGGVLLIWALAPSLALDFFNIPGGGITAQASRGELYSIGWAPPNSFPGQSPMGYFVSGPPPSFLGYYALVLPKEGAGEPVTVTFRDTVTSRPNDPPSPSGPRPWPIMPFTGTVGPGVSVLRHHAFPSAPPGPAPGPDDEFPPPLDMSYLCRF